METVPLTPELGLMNGIDFVGVCLVYSYPFQLSINEWRPEIDAILHSSSGKS